MLNNHNRHTSSGRKFREAEIGRGTTFSSVDSTECECSPVIGLAGAAVSLGKVSHNVMFSVALI